MVFSVAFRWWYSDNFVAMARTFASTVLWFTLSLFVVGCGGLDPDDLPPESFLEGTVSFTPNWPDSNVIQVLVVAFEEQPTSPDSILAAVLSGRAVISDTLPRYATQAPYRIQIPGPPRTFRYVVTAMQNGPNLLTDWLMLDVYAPSGDPLMPGTVNVGVAQSVTIDFSVDFDNLPPQPFQ